ncbi:hypothetical protein DRA43_14355 [Micromonospora provocatoris]|nr:hypothetical protein DRA43_14355 [Micromonospora provocatoris]
MLNRDARAAHTNRGAIIDAATALEIALGRHIRSHADQHVSSSPGAAGASARQASWTCHHLPSIRQKTLDVDNVVGRRRRCRASVLRTTPRACLACRP